MTKKIGFLLLTALYFMTNTVKGQSYDIQSLEGKKVKINLNYKPASGQLSISYLTTKLLISNYMSIEHVEVLNKVFLKIEYAKRAGSNQDYMKEILLYVNNGKLYQALHVNSLRTYDMRPNEYSFFKLKTTFTGSELGKYKLLVNIHDENSSQSDPKTNYNYEKTATLSFDKTKQVFYNGLEHVIGNYVFHNSKEQKIKLYIKDEIPTIVIEKSKYFYINGDWYTKDKNDFYSMQL